MKKEASAFVDILDKKVDKKFNDGKLTLATKEDVTQAKLDMVKWMVCFWIVQMAAIIGLYLKKQEQLFALVC